MSSYNDSDLKKVKWTINQKNNNVNTAVNRQWFKNTGIHCARTARTLMIIERDIAHWSAAYPVDVMILVKI